MLETYTKNKFNEDRSLKISHDLVNIAKKRRTTRVFTGEVVSDELIDNAIRIAGLAPSGANKQPWFFCKISDASLKREIRLLSEKREREFYIEKPNKKWIEDLKQFHTSEDKSFLESASHLIPIFYKNTEVDKDGDVSKNYYAKESTGLACGMLINTLHLIGLQTLTYTPTKMTFLRDLLQLHKSYVPFMMIVIGVAPDRYEVPKISKKSLSDISKSYILDS